MPERPTEAPRESSPKEPTPAVAVTAGYSGMWDVAVGVGVVAAAALLLFPAIQNSRFHARLAECQDHLRQLGVALNQYGESHDDYFPPVYDCGRLAGAGIYAPILLTQGFVDGPRWFFCPGAPRGSVAVPTLDELLSAPAGDELIRLRRGMGGDFAYALGFVERGRYHFPRNLRRPHFPVMADNPNPSVPDYQSINHDGLGQNLLYEGGGVHFSRTTQPHDWADNVFVNELNVVGAGWHRNDCVLGSSAALPSLPEWVECQCRP